MPAQAQQGEVRTGALIRVCADRTELDHECLRDAVETGRIEALVDS